MHEAYESPVAWELDHAPISLLSFASCAPLRRIYHTILYVRQSELHPYRLEDDHALPWPFLWGF